MRLCDFCGLSLLGKRRHAFVTRTGKLSCGRSETQATSVDRDGKPTLKRVTLPCAKASS